MNSKQDNGAFKGNDDNELKEGFDLKQVQMQTHEKVFKTEEIKSGCEVSSSVSCRNKMYIPCETDYLEHSLFVKKEFTNGNNVQVTNITHESQPTSIDVDENKIRQEIIKVDTNSDRSHFLKAEINNHESFKDTIKESIEDNCLHQSYKNYAQLQNNYFMCDLCNQQIHDKKTLKTHCVGHLKTPEDADVIHSAKVHEKLKIYACEICEKYFPRISSLKRHDANVHNKLKQYSCEICKTSFSEMSNLNKHINSVHNSFSQPSSLEEHMIREHNKIKQWTCTICKKSFSHKADLKKHITNVHIKDKQWTCIICKKSFSHKGNLKMHINSVHNKLKPYHCEACEKSFSQKIHLLKHMCTGHNKLQQHLCVMCEKLFSNRSELNRHIAKEHV